VKDVRDMAEQIIRKRDPTETVSPRWIDRFLCKHHPDIKARWSRQLDRIRASHGNNFAALELFFEKVRVWSESEYVYIIANLQAISCWI